MIRLRTLQGDAAIKLGRCESAPRSFQSPTALSLPVAFVTGSHLRRGIAVDSHDHEPVRPREDCVLAPDHRFPGR